MSKALVKTKAEEIVTFVTLWQERIQEAAIAELRMPHVISVLRGEIYRNPKIAQCTPVSVLECVRQTVALNLELGGMLGQAYIVPFYNGKKGVYEAQFMPGYQGLCTLAYRHPSVTAIQAEVVCKGDEFDYALGTDAYVKHRIPKDHLPYAKFNKEGELVETNVEYVWAVIDTKDSGRIVAVAPLAVIEAHRSRSRAKDGPWFTDYGPMSKKTAILIGLKTAPKSKEATQAIALENAAELGKYAGDIIDLPPLEVVDAEEGGENKPSSSPAPSSEGEEPVLPPEAMQEVFDEADAHNEGRK